MDTREKILEYICKDKLRTALLLFLSMHIFYSIAFLIVNVDVGNTIHMLATLIYVILLVQLRDGEARIRILSELVVQITIFTIISTYTFGWNAGYGLFLLVMIPALFFIGADIEKPSWYNKVVSVSMLTIFFILVCISNQFVADTIVEWEHYRHQCYVINMVFVALILLCFGILFDVEIQKVEIDLKDKNLRLIQMANHDVLTGLFNRRVINEMLQVASSAKREYGHDYSICICDIDDFKKINDTYGHDCGDYVLKEVARLLLENSKTEQVGRWGGEEFIIVLSNTTSADSFSIINDVRKAIDEHCYEYAGQKIDVTMTFGMSHSKYMNGADKMLLQADSRLYEGKLSGKNCVKA